MSFDHFFATLTNVVDRDRAAPPHERGFARVGGGAGLIGFCVYVAIATKTSLGINPWDEVRATLILKGSTPWFVWVPLAVWGALFLLGIMWFFVGIRSPRGPRDIMGAFWAVVRAGIFGALLWWSVFLPRDWGWWALLVNLILGGFYVAALVDSIIWFVLSLRGPGRGQVAKMVSQQKAHGDADFVPEEDLPAQMSRKRPRS